MFFSSKILKHNGRIGVYLLNIYIFRVPQGSVVDPSFFAFGINDQHIHNC